MIMVDSSVWIDYFNGTQTDASDFLDAALGNKNLIIGDLILTEVLQGFKSEKDFNQGKRLLTAFEVRPLLSQELAVCSAQNFRYFRKKGITVRKTIDVIIATYCIENDITLLHSDRDFLPFAKHLGLKVLPE
ncbi:twitching motility protein PilT [Endozoicomonas montiporae]|uniref:Twitching motility protein PilT n=2 Tax=Endozoicomonas montiporae TaxID=1027273 RepID=A0A081N3C7_9GAMM|nr:PIN domain nuclease [Endozoicomonas montiporae]AMO58247.1 PilT protein domain-containing protein [Endozoicomonas montiporae CL-33]KEQ12950.1 twitching motility protein PilT [Endozoicomonas montiporae]